MRKDFVVEYPDEPYKAGCYSLKKTVKATYTGPRYLLLEIKDSDIEQTSCRNDDINEVESYLEENKLEGTSLILDADTYPWEAAYLTGEYHHDDIPDYVYELEDGSTFEYVYSIHTGILTQCWLPHDLTYDLEEQRFYRPRERLHMMSRSSYFDGVKRHREEAEKELYDNRKLSIENRELLTKFVQWCDDAPLKYKDVDHWKIPWPGHLLPNS